MPRLNSTADELEQGLEILGAVLRQAREPAAAAA